MTQVAFVAKSGTRCVPRRFSVLRPWGTRNPVGIFFNGIIFFYDFFSCVDFTGVVSRPKKGPEWGLILLYIFYGSVFILSSICTYYLYEQYEKVKDFASMLPNSFAPSVLNLAKDVGFFWNFFEHILGRKIQWTTAENGHAL